MRLLVFLYGLIAYVSFLGVFLYAVGFVGGIVVPKGIDDGPVGDPTTALLVDALLLAVFAVQHSTMARPGFKARWTRIVSPAIERSTFVMVTNVLFVVLFWQWRPLPQLVWSVDGAAAAALWILFWSGWSIVLASTFMIDHFDLFGLRQVAMHLRGEEYTPPRHVERFFYRLVRHPLMLGFVIAFWSAPEMSEGRLLFAAMTTVYIVVAIHIEERDLVAAHPEYQKYRERVSMLFPFPRAKRP